jgi:predicted protein tyrosine phosphatase
MKNTKNKVKLLFVCSQNRLRSPTAEILFDNERFETDSAGLNEDANQLITVDLLLWSDIIFCMEKSHKKKLSKLLKHYNIDRQLICLNIPDEFEFLESGLIELLNKKVYDYFGE